jgi:hypothetical protein
MGVAPVRVFSPEVLPNQPIRTRVAWQTPPNVQQNFKLTKKWLIYTIGRNIFSAPRNKITNGLARGHGFSPIRPK